MATKLTARERATSAANAVLLVWRNGQLPDLLAQSVLQASTGRPCATWSLGNRVLMLAQGTTDARGYKQWQAVGRHVSKGARSICILGPVLRKREGVNAQGEPTESAYCAGFRGIPVFRIEDTEGEPVETSDYAPDALPPLQEVAARIGARVSYSPALIASLGQFRPESNRIELFSHDTATWFHELAHAVDSYNGTLTRGKRKDDSGYRDSEVVAEFTAATLCKLYGIEYDHNALKYIQHFRADAPKAVYRLFARIEAVLTFILETETDSAPAELKAEAAA